MWALEIADFQSILRRSLYDERSEKQITLVNAAQKIQCAVRLFLARQAVKRIIGRRFIKIYDTVTREYVYKDKSTQRIQISKPSLLGCTDLPSPRSLVAPDHYDPHYNSRNSDCHAIVITVSSFIHKDVIPDLPIETIAEHETLKDILSHDFICKVPPDKVISLLNPRCNDFQAAFLHLRKVCRMNDSLLVYICTHIGTRLNVDRNKDENGYFLMHDTNWRSAKEIAQSSISISAICQLLNKILCKSKTILLNCVHQGRQPFKLFGAQELYPPSDYFSRLSDGANCLVIGSCMIGAPISDIINHTHTPSVLSQSTDQFRSGAVNVATLGRKYSLTSWMTSAIKISPAHKNQPEIYHDNGNSRLTRILNPRNSNLRKLLFPNIKMLRNGDSKIGVNNGCDITDGDGLEAGMKFLKLNKSMDISKNSMVNSPDPVRFPPLLSLSYSAKEKIYLQYFDDWKVPITSDLTPIIKPAQPRVSWSRDNIKADCGSDYNFNLPTDQEVGYYTIPL